jgi:hypothetical protein
MMWHALRRLPIGQPNLVASDNQQVGHEEGAPQPVRNADALNHNVAYYHPSPVSDGRGCGVEFHSSF